MQLKATRKNAREETRLSLKLSCHMWLSSSTKLLNCFFSADSKLPWAEDVNFIAFISFSLKLLHPKVEYLLREHDDLLLSLASITACLVEV